MAKKKSILKTVQEKEAAFNEKLAKPIEIGYDKDRAFTLTNAGSLTGAHLSEEMTDYIIQEAEKAGIDLQTAFGIAAAESTLGNPTDDKSAWNISSGIRRAFDNVYPGTAQHINTHGDVVNEQELFNFYYPLENQNPYTLQIAEADRQARKGKDFEQALMDGMSYADRQALKPVPTGSVALQAFEYFKLNGEGYAPGYKEQTGQSYVLHVRKKGKEALQSSEIQKAIANYALKKIGRPKDYSFGTFDVEPAEWLKKAEGGPLNLKPWEGLSMRERAAYIRDAVSRGLNTVTDIRNDYNEYKEGGKKKTNNGSVLTFLNLLNESLKGNSRYNTTGWRKYLTDLAKMESSYRGDVTNSIGAKGYFLLMPSNRSASWSTPTQLFHEMYKLSDANMDYFRKNMTERDLKLAEQMGIDIYGLMAGAHLGGPKNALAALRGGRNNKDKNGTSVLSYMTRFSQTTPRQPVSGDFKTVYFQPPIEETPEIEVPNPYVGYKLISLEDIDNLPLPSRIGDDEIAFEGTAPETIITPEPQKLYIQYTPKEIFDQMSSMITPYEPVELPKPLTATERLKEISDNRVSLLLKDLEDSIIRSYRLNDFDKEKLRRDVEDLLFYRNMAAYGGDIGDDDLVQKNSTISVAGLPYVSTEVEISPEASLRRANRVYSNYDQAVDAPLSWGQKTARNTLRWLKDNINENIPSGVSNCTLSATLWVDPTNPIKNASSIVNDPNRYNYEPIEAGQAQVGDVLITRNPNDGSYHTMLISGYSNDNGVYDFDGTLMNYSKNEPLLTYSRGGHDASFIRRDIPLSVYLLNSDGKTEQHFFRYNKPSRVLKVILKARKKALGGNLFDGITQPTQQMNSGLNLYRRTNNLGETEYIYQETPDSEEILLTPTNKRFSDDPTNWDYIDASGREYSPRMTTAYNPGEIRKDTRGPLERMVDNYFGELKYQVNNNVPISGKYTMPTIAAAPFLAWAGEAAYPYVSTALANPYVDAGLTSAFAGHGLNHAINEGINGWGDAAMTALEIAPLGRLAKPLYKSTSNVVNSAYNRLPWTYRIPENPNMAYRRMSPIERDWIMEGNELSTRATNPLTEAERDAAVAAEKAVNPNRRFILFKAGAEHGGRKQFAKGQPWRGTTVTHGEEQVLAIPGKDLPWVSGRHFHGPQGDSFGVGDISFEEAPFGSHIDLLTEEGYTGVNPSLLDSSVIYSPYKMFGHNFGYKKLYPKVTTPQITVENAASITPEQLTILGSASDSPYKDNNGFDLLVKHLYNKKIHGYPSYTREAMQFDPVAGDFTPVLREWADNVVTGLPKYAQDAIMHDVVDRNIAEFMSEGLSLEEATKYAEAARKQLSSVRSGIYSQGDYDKAGWGDFGGFYDPERNFISINEAGNPKRIYTHEGRHLLDHKIDDEILFPRESTTFGTDFDSDVSNAIMQRTRQKQEMILRDAYDNDFESIPSSKYAEGLENYNSMNREAITTNLDSRTYAYDNFADVNSLNSGTRMEELPIEELNAFIDNLTDELVFEAIEHANGYGRRYINRLRDEGKLTSKKAQQFREAMKHVGVAAVPAAAGAGLLFGQNN